MLGRKGWSKGKKRPEISGKNHYNWKEYLKKGYKVVHCQNHPFSSKKGYIQQHRLIVEEFIGRYLTKREVIHHINRIKTDNRIENLMIFKSSSEHLLFHLRLRQFGITNPISRQILNRWKEYENSEANI